MLRGAGYKWLQAGLSQSPILTKKGPKLHPGLHKLNYEDWLVVDASKYHEEMELKDRRFEHEREKVFVSSHPEAEKEIWELVSAYLCKKYPEHFEMVGECAARGPGERFVEDSNSLLRAARLAQEDLFLLVDGRLVSAACCFSFAGAGKRARNRESIDELHRRVGGFDSDLAKPVKRMFANLNDPVWRSNWSVSLTDSLVPTADRDFLNPTKRAETFSEELSETPENLLEMFRRDDGVENSCFCKMEFQTMTKLTSIQGAVFFTVHTYVESFRDLSPRAAEHLAQNVQHAANHEVKVYKNLADRNVADHIINYLREKSQQPLTVQ